MANSQNAGRQEVDHQILSTGWMGAMAAVGAVSQAVLNAGQEGDFKIYYITVQVRQGAAGAEVLVANFAGDILLRDNSAGRDIMNVAAPVDSIAGNGQLPYQLTPPRILGRNNTIAVTVTSNVVTRTQVAVSLHGTRLE